MRILQIGTIAVLALVTVVAVGVNQSKLPRSDRPAESKGQLERLREEHFKDVVPLRK